VRPAATYGASVARKLATNRAVDRTELLAFLAGRHRAVLVTTRVDGSPQLSPVTAGIDDLGRVVVSTYPSRAKVVNLRKQSVAHVLFLSDDWDGPWVQVSGSGEVLDLPEALEPLVDYYRSIAGEHPDWDEYRAAMRAQGKSLIRITIERWGPVATGGFPPGFADT
jgi:PPOX class probable F420-dependent enzyme